jgi:hypothetical protein
LAGKFSKRKSGQLTGRKTSLSNKTGGDAPRREALRRLAKRQDTHGTVKRAGDKQQ